MAAATHFRRPSDFGIDPVSLEPLVDFVVDQCGHTFNRATIDEMVATVRPGEPVLCPISRKAIDIDNLAHNLMAREAVDYCGHLEAEGRKISAREMQLQEELAFERRANIHSKKQSGKEFNYRLDAQRREFTHRLNQKQEELDYERKEREVESKKVNEKLDQLIKLGFSNQAEITRLNKRVTVLTSDLKKTRAENRKMHLTEQRKSRNLREMSYRDKLLITFGDCLGSYDHLQTVLDRGIKKA